MLAPLLIVLGLGFGTQMAFKFNKGEYRDPKSKVQTKEFFKPKHSDLKDESQPAVKDGDFVWTI